MGKITFIMAEAEGTDEQVQGVLGAFLEGLNEAQAGSSGVDGSYTAGRQKPDRPWSDYPLGTVAHALGGGHWTRVEGGWQWMDGATFPRPGADAYEVTPAV